MGHCDSPSQLGRHGGFFGAGRGVAAFDSSQERSAGARREELTTRRATSAGCLVLLAFLRIYKIFLSPFFGGACKYHPSCSNYAYDAVQRHGARRGVVLAVGRLGRCRPFTPGGYDPVPDPADTVAGGGCGCQSPVHQGLADSRPLR
jgi:putative membrane protein insertion efficiency factor